MGEKEKKRSEALSTVITLAKTLWSPDREAEVRLEISTWQLVPGIYG